MPTSQPANPRLVQRLCATLARAVELEATFEAQHRLPVHSSSPLRRDEAVGNAASGFNIASVAVVGALVDLRTWYQIIAGDRDASRAPVETLPDDDSCPGATFASFGAWPRSVRKRRRSRWAVVDVRGGAERDDGRASVNPGLYVMPTSSIRKVVVESCRRPGRVVG